MSKSTEPCKHPATFGEVGAEWQRCLKCHEKVHNDEWEDDLKTLKELDEEQPDE